MNCEHNFNDNVRQKKLGRFVRVIFKCIFNMNVFMFNIYIFFYLRQNINAECVVLFEKQKILTLLMDIPALFFIGATCP